MSRIKGPSYNFEELARTEGYYEGYTAGLVEAKRRLSAAGMHDAICPEPTSPCNCGLDAAIDGRTYRRPSRATRLRQWRASE